MNIILIKVSLKKCDIVHFVFTWGSILPFSFVGRQLMNVKKYHDDMA